MRSIGPEYVESMLSNGKRLHLGAPGNDFAVITANLSAMPVGSAYIRDWKSLESTGLSFSRERIRT